MLPSAKGQILPSIFKLLDRATKILQEKQEEMDIGLRRKRREEESRLIGHVYMLSVTTHWLHEVESTS